MKTLLRQIGRLSLPFVCFFIGFLIKSLSSSSSASIVRFQRVGLWQSFSGQRLRELTAVALGPDGSMLVSDRVNQQVYRVGLDGKLLFTCGGVGQAPGSFRRPFGVTSDDHGRVYVADTDNNRIQVFDSQLRLLQVIDPGLPRPAGVATDGHGGLWVSPGEYSGIKYPLVHLDPGGKVTRCAGLPLAGLLKRDDRGRIWAMDDLNDAYPVKTLDTAGNRMSRLDVPLDIVEDVAVDRGRIFVGERGKARMRVFDEDGRQIGEATRDDIRMPDGNSQAPYSLAFDKDGYLWATFLDAGTVARYRILSK